MRIAAGFASLLALSTAAAAGETAGPAETVAAYHAALAAGDAPGAEALLAADAVVMEGGFVESRAEYLAHHLAADLEFARAITQQRSDVRVVQRGDVAWVSARSRARGKLRGRSVNGEGAELIVLSREPEGWRIRAIHWSSKPAASSPAPVPLTP